MARRGVNVAMGLDDKTINDDERPATGHEGDHPMPRRDLRKRAT